MDPNIAQGALIGGGLIALLMGVVIFRFVTRDDNAADPEVAAFIRLYQSSPAVRARIDAANAHDPKLYSLPWLD